MQILSARPVRLRHNHDGCQQAENTRMALVRIYKPTKSAMQSGRGRSHKWVLEYEPASRREPDPLMGWTSAHDTLNEIGLRFDTLDEAVAYAQKRGLDYTVIEPQERSAKQKSYADNFAYNRIRV